jgi:cytochrome P450
MQIAWSATGASQGELMRNTFDILSRAVRSVRNRSRTLQRFWRIRLRALRDGLRPLPPGRLRIKDYGYWSDDLFLLRQSQRYGAVFKTSISGQVVVCVVGHRHSRAILTGNAERLASPDAPYNRLVPGGFLRCQAGETHRATRQVFVQALSPDLVESNAASLREIARRELLAFASACAARAPRDDELVRTLDRIATAMLLLVVFGVRLGDAAFAPLLNGYARLGPKELVWEVGPAQQEAFADLTTVTRELIADLQRSTADRGPSLLRELVEDVAPIDDTIVGNLIYMVEMGRFDLYSLFHWLTKYLSDYPAVVAAIREEKREPPVAVSLATATVLETLRLNQSEAIVRKVLENITYDGWGIPKGAYVRACMREGHRDPMAFVDPDRFDPQRFVARHYGPDEYSPFGFDHHRCIAGDLVVRLGAILTEELVDGFSWQVLSDGAPQRGFYHWMPSAAFAIQLTPRR